MASPTVLIAGSPRSGTTWLGKVLDSHPDVLYRHEPDASAGDRALPAVVDPEAVQCMTGKAKAFLETMRQAHDVRTVGTRPFFRKRYRGLAAHAAVVAQIYAMKGLERVFWPGGAGQRLRVAELVRGGAAPVPVVKSVSALGQAALYRAADPDLHILHLLRHPCGQIASVVRGRKAGLMKGVPYIHQLARSAKANALGLDPAMTKRLSYVEQLAWSWTVRNSMAYDALQADPLYRVVLFERLVAEAETQVPAVLAFCGLTMNGQVTRFVEASRASQGEVRYFDLRRDPVTAIQRWRKDLEPEEIDVILAIASRAPVGRLFTG